MGVWHKKRVRRGGRIDGRLIKLTGNVGGRTSDADVGACHGERLEGVPNFHKFLSYTYRDCRVAFRDVTGPHSHLVMIAMLKS